MTTLLWVRHGETDWNRDMLFQGQIDVPLNEKGSQQAEALMQKLSSVSIDFCYASDLKRASETARIILSGRNVPMRLTPALREAHLGEWQGLSRQQVHELFPDLVNESQLIGLAPGGESMEQLVTRVGAFVDEVLHGHAGQRILLVCHGGPIKAAICHLFKVANPHQIWLRFRLSNTSLTIIEHDGQRAFLKCLNDTCAAPGAVSFPYSGGSISR